MIDNSDLMFFLLGIAAGGGYMRWQAYRWYSEMLSRKSSRR